MPSDRSDPEGPAREVSLPYARQWIDEEDVESVVAALQSDWLTTGPRVPAFEAAFADAVGADEAVAVSSGTAALHAAIHAADVGPGDEVVLPALTFAATANAVVFEGGTPVFADVDPATLLLDPEDAATRITSKTKALLPVDYAGQPCDYDALGSLAEEHDLLLIADGCHALGAEYQGRTVGTLADLTAFSFHPVKHITTGEGGMIATQDVSRAERMRRFRNHGIDRDAHRRAARGTWYYEMQDLGYNYRITDLQCALGLSQLRKLPRWLERRRHLAARYDRKLEGLDGVTPLAVRDGATSAYHLYVVQVDPPPGGPGRDALYAALREEGIGANVHYIPVHLHPYYRRTYETGPGLCPAAEAAYERILTLPLFPAMRDGDVGRVVSVVRRATKRGEA